MQNAQCKDRGVIPAKPGIHSALAFQKVKINLDSRVRGNDGNSSWWLRTFSHTAAGMPNAVDSLQHGLIFVNGKDGRLRQPKMKQDESAEIFSARIAHGSEHSLE